MAKNLLTPAFDVYEQMALDEVLAHSFDEEAVLRFYHWTLQEAVTFGYGQFYQFVRKQTGDKIVCRRPTGGGIVFHAEDLTFSLVFQSPTGNPREIYARLHSAIEQSLIDQACLKSSRQTPVAAGAYAPTQAGIAAGCFVNPVEDDLLLDGKKILGGAIRRFGNKILYQGSLQCAQARTNPQYRRAILHGMENALQVKFQTAAVTDPILSQARQLAQNQYSTEAWNQKF